MAKSRRGAVVCYCVLTWAQVSGRKDDALTRLHDPDPPDPPVGEFGASELGAMLCESRVLLGRELEDVAAELKIRLAYLQAIEDGRLDDLPGTTYATGFLRAYADLLRLDGEDLVRQFKAAGMAAPQATDLHLPSPVEDGRLPTGLVLLVAALLAVGAYGGWYYMSSQDQDPTENVAVLPERFSEFVGIDLEKNQNSGAKGSNSRIAPSTSSTNNTGMLDTGDAVEPMARSDVTNGDAATAPTLPPERTAEVETNQGQPPQRGH